MAGASLFTFILIAQSLIGQIAATQSANSTRVSNAKRTKILIIGPSGSGKTKLFYKLVAGDHETLTVSSTETNISNSNTIVSHLTKST